MRYKKDVLRKNRFFILFYVLIGVFCAFLTNFKASYFQKVVDGLTAHSISLGPILFYGALLVFEFLANYLDNFPEKQLEHGIYLDFKMLALRKTGLIDYSEYQKLGTGKLIQRIENGAEAGRSILLHFWLCVIRQLLPTIFFSIYFIWKISRPITYVILGGYVIVFFVTNLLLKTLYRIKEGILTNEEKLNHYLVRGFMEMPVFRLARQFPHEIYKAEAAKREIVCAKVKMQMIHEAFFTAFALLVALLDVGILIYAWNTGSVSTGSVVALLSLLNNAYTPIAIFNVLYVQYKLDQSSFQRYEEFLSLKDDPQLKCGQELKNCQGGITIRNLSFCYGKRQLFNNLNLDIHPGEKVAFVGESGSGKSTLLRILAGLLKYGSGSVKIDGSEVKRLHLNSLYRHMSYLFQDSSVFDGTLRENIVFDRQEPDKLLLTALEKVCLIPLLRTMKDGLDTRIGEKGAVLSGGEQQRVALARLWFEKKEITVLDEATSNLDNLTEETVMREVTSLLKSHTVIAVAHKLNSVIHFDRIVVFRKGEIIEQGTFQELMAKNSYFSELYWANTK